MHQTARFLLTAGCFLLTLAVPHHGLGQTPTEREPPTNAPQQAPIEIEAGPGLGNTAPDQQTSDGTLGAPSPAGSEASIPRADASEGQPLSPSQATTGQVGTAREPIEVLVAGSRVARAPGSVQVIKSSQLERFEYDDPHQALLQVPGVYVRQEDGFGLRPNISIRGGNPDRSKKLTLMEDGVLFGPAPYSAPAAYYFPLLTRMQSIQVVKGPSAVAYGPQTVGGAINFITRSIPAVPRGGLDLALGAFGHRKAHAHFGASTEQFGFLVEGVHLHNTGFKELASGADTGFSRNEWMVKGSYLLDPWAKATQQFEVKLGYSDEVSNETYLGLTDSDFQLNPNRRYPSSSLDQMRNHRNSLVLSHVLSAPTLGVKLTNRLYRHNYERAWRKLNRFGGSSLAEVLRDPESPASAEYYAILTGKADSVTAGQELWIGPNDRRFVSQGLQSTLELKATTGDFHHSLLAGARLHQDSIARHHSERAYVMLEGELVPQDTATVVTTVNEASTVALAAHMLDAISWRSLTLTPGIRIELIDSELDDRLTREISNNSLVAWMPGAGAYYALLPEFGLLAGVHRGFSPPPAGRVDADPEYSLNYEAGARLSTDGAGAEVIGFYNDYTNLTNICTFSGGCASADLDRQFDAGEARVYGFEAYLTHDAQLARTHFPVTLAYTYSRGSFQSDFVSADPIYGSVERGDELPYLPRHQLVATLAVEWSHSGAQVAAHYSSAMREEAGREPLDTAWAADDRFSLDVGSKVMPTKWWTVYGNVRNLLDTQRITSHRPFGARPNAPRWVQVGTKLSF
jgi:Fe(3+) dicitrate transport protein